MLNKILADYILERMEVMFTLCMQNLYSAEHINLSVLIFDEKQVNKLELFSNIHTIEQTTIDKLQDAIVSIFDEKDEETFNRRVENLILHYFNKNGYTNIVIGIYQVYSQIIINIISYRDEDYKYIYKIENNVFNNTHYPQSLFDAIIRIIKYHLHYFEIKEDIDECKLYYNPISIHNEAAQSFLGIVGASSSKSQSLDLLHNINNLSNLTYENKIGRGRVIFSKADNFQYAIKLQEPIEARDSRRTRKLLEICSEHHALLSDGHKIFGIGAVAEEHERYVLDIYDQCCWQMSHAGTILLRSEFGKISVEQRGINPRQLTNNIIRIFGNDNVTKIASLIDTISKSGHGSIIVISEGAQAESERLGVNGFLPELCEPHHSLLNQLSKIDGAVMLDPKLCCYGFGIILDGVSVPKQDASRGSRYNSSLRYYSGIQEKFANTLILVTSEDGMVDFIPPLKRS